MKFWMVRLYLDVSDVIHINERTKYANWDWPVNLLIYLLVSFCFMKKILFYFGLRSSSELIFTYFLIINSQSLSLSHMGNGVHFFLLIDIASLSDYKIQSIGWFFIAGGETHFQAPFQSHIEPIFQNYSIPYIPFDR